MLFMLSAHPPLYQKGWKLYSFHNAVENRHWGCEITVVIHKCLWNEKSQSRERISQVLSICCSAFYYPQRQVKDNFNYHNFHTQNINKNWLLVLCFSKSSYYFPLSLPVIVLRKLIFDSSSNQKDLKWLQDYIYEILSCLGDSETATEAAVLNLKAMFVVCVFESPGLIISGSGQG